MSTGVETLKNWFQRVWKEADADAVMELMAERAAVRGLEEEELSGAEEFRLFQQMLVAQFSDIEVTIVRGIEQGEWVAALLRITAVHRASGTPLSGRGHIMCRFVDGKLVEGHNLVDFVQIFEQLGLLPERTMDQLLLGQRPQFMPDRLGGETLS